MFGNLIGFPCLNGEPTLEGELLLPDNMEFILLGVKVILLRLYV